MKKMCFRQKILSIGLLASVSLTACSTAPIAKRNTTTAMVQERVSVLTGSSLSSDTQSRLIQAGLDENDCLVNMPNCIVTLQKSDLGVQPDKGLYGAIAELFFASAKQKEQGKNCVADVKTLATDFAKDFQPIDSQKNIDKSKSCLNLKQDDLLQAVRFSYIYLMYDMLKDTPTTTPNSLLYLPKERDTQIKDLYYASIDELGNELYEEKLINHYQINGNQILVKLNNENLNVKGENTGKLVSSYQINLKNLNSISRRDGFGINYVAILDDRYTTSIRNQILNNSQNDVAPSERIHKVGHLPVTVLLTPKGDSLENLIKTTDFSLNLYDPYQVNQVNLFDKPFALSANFSAPYGLWIKENALEPLSIFNMLASPYQNSQPQLFMLEPYNPNKRVIIMLHGLASSPDTWIRLTNDIFNDPLLRDNYQVWQMFYPTNVPILENRYQIAELIKTAFHDVDPNAQDNASHHAVIIGHSMGGVIGRMLVSDDDLTPNLKQIVENHIHRGELPSIYRNFEKLSDNEKLELSKRLALQALPEIDRAVFISAPFQGTDYADRWFTRGLRRIISIPAGFVKTVTASLNALFTDAQLNNNPLAGLFLENGASQLSDKSFFMRLTKDVKIKPNVAVNTLIATDDKDLYDALNTQAKQQLKQNDLPSTQKATTPITAIYNQNSLDKAKAELAERDNLLAQVSEGATERLSDGIVPYQSASLKGVESEKILSGKHNVHTSPQAVLELRRILHKHLQNYPTTTIKSVDKQP